MDYDEIELTVWPRDPQGHRVNLRAASGSADTYCDALPSPDDVATDPATSGARRDLAPPPGQLSTVSRTTMTPEQVKRFGTRLFDVVFSGEVGQLFRVSYFNATSHEQGLRINLVLRAPELASLPWEFLFDTGTNQYLALAIETPIVRYLQFAEIKHAPLLKPPMRVLGLISSPAGLPPLDVASEKLRIETALGPLTDHGLATLEWLASATSFELLNALGDPTSHPCHVFHFIGHGYFDGSEGSLILTDDHGEPDFVPAELLALALNHPPLRLAVLNACDGARGNSLDIFSSAAATLVRQRLPAVVAMQRPVEDRAAVSFAGFFYRGLAYGLPVHQALTHARKGLALAFPKTTEWGTPVLHSRSPSGILFDLPDKGQQEPEDQRVFADATTIDFGTLRQGNPSPEQTVNLFGLAGGSEPVASAPEWATAVVVGSSTRVSVDTSRPGRREGMLVIQAGVHEVSVALSAEVQPARQLQIEPSALDFGTLALGAEPPELIVDVRDWANRPVRAVRVRGPDLVSVEAGEGSVTVAVDTSRPGRVDGTVRLSTALGDADIQVLATVEAPPALRVEPASVDFGAVVEGDRRPHRPVQILLGEAPAPASVVDRPDWVEVVEHDGWIDLSVDTSRPAHLVGSVTVVAGGSQVSFPVTARVVEPLPMLEIDQSRVDFGAVIRGTDSPTRIIRYRNAGGGELRLRVMEVPEGVHVRETPTALEVVLRTDRVGPVRGDIRIASVGGEAAIPVSAAIRRPAPPPWLLAAGALGAAALLALLLWPERCTAGRCVVEVDGAKPWTGTGLEVRAGDRISITATDTVLHDKDDPTSEVGPEGDADVVDPNLNKEGLGVFVQPPLHGGLLAKVSGSQAPSCGEPGYRGERIVGVGSELTFVSQWDGHLCLGVNDYNNGSPVQGAANNRGGFSATVTVRPGS